MKNKVQVTIEGKTFTIIGEESQDYILNVADYINRKILEVKRKEEVKGVSINMIPILTALNIADDYFKELNEKNNLSEKVEFFKQKYEELDITKDELHNLKNELQESKNKNNQFSKDLENLKKESEEKNIQFNKEIERIKSEKQQTSNLKRQAEEKNVQLNKEIERIKRESQQTSNLKRQAEEKNVQLKK